jgi:hypothetical protein
VLFVISFIPELAAYSSDRPPARGRSFLQNRTPYFCPIPYRRDFCDLLYSANQLGGDATMKSRGTGFVQLGDLRSDARWTAGDWVITIQFSTDTFGLAEWEETRRLQLHSEPVFLLCDGIADSDHHVIGYERSLGSVTFYLATPYPLKKMRTRALTAEVA